MSFRALAAVGDLSRSSASSRTTVSRKTFLSVATASAFGIFTLAAPQGAVARSVKADSDQWLTTLKYKGQELIEDPDVLARLQGEAFSMPSLRDGELAKASSVMAGRQSAARDGGSTVGSDDFQRLSAVKRKQQSAEQVIVVRHRTQDGYLDAASFVVGNITVLYYKHRGRTINEREVKLLAPNPYNDDIIDILGRGNETTIQVAISDAMDAIAAGGCDSRTCGRQNPCLACECGSLSLSCVFNCCAHCALGCVANPGVCIACVGAYCPVCLIVNKCCRSQVCGWRPSCQ